MPVKRAGLAALLRRRRFLRPALLLLALLVVLVWGIAQWLQPAPAHRITIASGVEGGMYQRYAQRYAAILARYGVTVDERLTHGSGENLQLLLDPNSGVDVAFMQAGVATLPAADNLMMLASLYYEPLWVFYRGSDVPPQINDFRGKRIAIGIPGGGTQAFLDPLLEANGLTSANSTFLPIGGSDAIRALGDGSADVAIFLGGANTPFIMDALKNPALKLMSFVRADAYARRYPYITKLTLPPGTIDFAASIPSHEIALIGTKAMLVAREGLHPALINLLVDAAQEVHSAQGFFEAAGEFPGTSRVDIPVSADADRHKRFGPSFLHRYLPFWVATFVERLIVLVVPLVVLLVPLLSYLPQVVRWRVRSRIYRWYGELTLLERDVGTRTGALPTEQWLHDLDRIERAVEGIRTPASFASEAYTLREHVALVRRAVLAKSASAA